jgi:ATP-dependent RNA helicase RhlE
MSLVCDEEVELLRNIEKLIKREIQKTPVEGFECTLPAVAKPAAKKNGGRSRNRSRSADSRSRSGRSENSGRAPRSGRSDNTSKAPRSERRHDVSSYASQMQAGLR